MVMVAMIGRFMPATDFKPVAAHNLTRLRGGIIAPGFGRSNVVGIFTLSGIGQVELTRGEKVSE